MKKRVLAWLLLFSLLLACLPLGAVAEDKASKRGLYYRSLQQIYNTDNFYEDTSEPLKADLSGKLGNYMVIFYYVDEAGTETKLEWEDIDLPDELFSASAMEEDPEHFVCLRAQNVGDGKISYTRDGENYDLPVTITLPDVGFYSGEAMSAETYLQGNRLIASGGTTHTVYFYWQERYAPGAQKLLVDLSGSSYNTERVLEKADPEDADTQAILRKYGIVIQEWDFDAHRIKMEVTAGKNAWLILYLGDRGVRFRVQNGDWMSGEAEEPSFYYRGEPYFFRLCGYDPEPDKVNFSHSGTLHGIDMAYGMSELCTFGLVKNFDTEEEQEAPARFYSWISNIRYEISGLFDPEEPLQKPQPIVVTELEPVKVHGCLWPAVQLTAAGASQFKLTVRFTVTLPDSEPQEKYICYSLRYETYPDGAMDASALDTTEKLNAVLTDWDTFLAWVKKTDLKTYEASQKTGDFTFYLDLPAVEYDGIVQVKVDSPNPFVILRGHQGEDGTLDTVMHGLLLDQAECFAAEHIAFTADETVQQSYEGETFTCGVLAQCGNVGNRVRHSSFTGFDYGIRATQEGYLWATYGNLFEDCGIGYYMDSAGGSGRGDFTMANNAFVRCNTAIRVLRMPGTITPYSARVYNCDFIDNEMDLDIRCDGIFYLWKNYYAFSNPVQLPLTGAETLPRPSRLREENGAVIVTNPRYIFPCSTYFAEEGKKNYLYLDPHRLTMIVNEEARDLLLDWATLSNTAAQNGVVINVTDQDGNVEGVWDFEQD